MKDPCFNARCYYAEVVNYTGCQARPDGPLLSTDFTIPVGAA
jgi:hypothetical protein